MGKGRGRVTGGEYLLWGVWGGGRAMGFMVGQVAYQRARGSGGGRCPRHAEIIGIWSDRAGEEFRQLNKYLSVMRGFFFSVCEREDGGNAWWGLCRDTCLGSKKYFRPGFNWCTTLNGIVLR